MAIHDSVVHNSYIMELPKLGSSYSSHLNPFFHPSVSRDIRKRTVRETKQITLMCNRLSQTVQGNGPREN